MATRSNFALPLFNSMASNLMTQRPVTRDVPFATNNPSAAVKHSEPMNIVAIHYNEATREIRAVGADTNVRVCKIDRLESINHARELWTQLKAVKESGQIISFMAAGGFSPDRWFFDISAE